jgi:amino acid transporter
MLAQNKADIFAPIGRTVLGAWLGKLLIVAVLTSASAATQTAILPAARTALSMAAAGAIPAKFSKIHPRFFSPSFATLVMGGVSIVWYAGISLFSKSVLEDSILAVGLPIAFYYGLTGFACAFLYRRDLLKSAGNFILMGALPLAGALVMVFLFVKSCVNLASSGSATLLGIGTPVVIGAGSILAGLPLLMLARLNSPAYFKGSPRGP